MKKLLLIILCMAVGMGIFVYEHKTEAESVCTEPDRENTKRAIKQAQYFQPQKISTKLQKQMEGKSYTANANIAIEDLRYIKIKHFDFSGQERQGEIIVNKKIAKDTAEIFLDLYHHQYPLESVKLMDAFDGDDNRSMEANNTSAFNYRLIAGTSVLSRHGMGMAIDINPRLNPCVKGDSVDPDSGRQYIDRDPQKVPEKWREGIIVKNDYIYSLFQSYGFAWGGDWNSVKDYQHFEKE